MGLTDIKKYGNQIVNILIIVLALIIAYNIYKGQSKDIELLKAQKDGAIKKNAVLGEISKLEKEISSYKKTLGKRDASLLMNNINNIARESGIKIVSIRPEAERDYPVYIRYSFVLVINAENYHRVGKFISSLESSPDIYIVDSLNIKSSLERKEVGQPEEITADLILSTVFFKG